MRFVATVVALSLAPAAFGAARDRAIPFESIGNGYYSSGVPAAPLPGVAIRAIKIGATRYVDVYAFAGTFPTGGYSVAVRRLGVTRTGRQLCVSATLSRPAPGSGVTQALTQPWHRVRARQKLFGRVVPTRWVLFLDGMLVAASRAASVRACAAR